MNASQSESDEDTNLMNLLQFSDVLGTDYLKIH